MKQETVSEKKNDVMFEEIGKKLRFGFVAELKKPEIDKFERAAIIRRVLEDNNWSIRQMAQEMGFSKSTLEDWLLFENIKEDKYQLLRSTGVSEAEIYRQLRDRSKTDKGKETIDGMVPFDYKLNQIIRFIRASTNKIQASKETLSLLSELRNAITLLEQQIRKQGKM